MEWCLILFKILLSVQNIAMRARICWAWEINFIPNYIGILPMPRVNICRSVGLTFFFKTHWKGWFDKCFINSVYNSSSFHMILYLNIVSTLHSLNVYSNHSSTYVYFPRSVSTAAKPWVFKDTIACFVISNNVF